MLLEYSKASGLILDLRIATSILVISELPKGDREKKNLGLYPCM